MNTQPKKSDIVARAKTLAGNLPANYETAKRDLAELDRVDECKDWADKAEALASYARQSDDDTLLNYAKRVKGRAVRRCGELLKQFDGRGDHRKKAGTDHSSTQAQAGAGAGMSPRQVKDAVAVANVPADLFEQQIESDNPPTVTALADQGKTKRPKVTLPEESTKPGFLPATYFFGGLHDMEELIEQAKTPAFIIDAMSTAEIREAVKRAERIVEWLSSFITQAGGHNASS